MFRKYEKTFHVFPVTSKRNLPKRDIKRLLAGKVVVEEKMDGANVGIIRHSNGFSLQKRNSLVGSSVHEQFDFFYGWAYNTAYERIMSLPKDTLLYGELLYAVHHIFYDELPEYFLVFDVLRNGKWLNRRKRDRFCEEHGFHQVPLIAEGSFTKNELLELVPEKSAYGPKAEGIVVKRYSKTGYFRGKIVRPDFIEALEESDHWMNQSVKTNQLHRRTS